MSTTERDGDEVQARLGAVLASNVPGSGVDHVVVALPSYSLGESLLSHYADRIPALEHRYLLALCAASTVESCEVVFVSSQAPGSEVLDHYAGLLPAGRRAATRRRWRVFTVPDRSARPVAAKLLDRPDLLERLRDLIGGRPAFIEPWNVTEDEVEVSRRLGAPINGTSPRLRHLGSKSESRRLFARTGVPTPVGCEDVRTVDDVLAAIETIGAQRPGLRGVVVKHDDSGAGAGNAVVPLPDRGADREDVRARVSALPPSYLAALRAGGVVEEMVTAPVVASPSAQLDLDPSGRVRVLATHDQVLGGAGGQVYVGCRFPADPAYAAEIATHAQVVGRDLAGRGCVGRIGVDFVAASDGSGRWTVMALEINLRKGGTTHPYTALRNLVPGRYDAPRGTWVADDGTPRAYACTDNLVDDAWLGLPPRIVIDAVTGAGAAFDARSGTGVVLHMLSCLAIDGRFGLTAIGRSPEHAADLYRRAVAAVETAARPDVPLPRPATSSDMQPTGDALR